MQQRIIFILSILVFSSTCFCQIENGIVLDDLQDIKNDGYHIVDIYENSDKGFDVFIEKWFGIERDNKVKIYRCHKSGKEEDPLIGLSTHRWMISVSSIYNYAPDQYFQTVAENGGFGIVINSKDATIDSVFFNGLLPVSKKPYYNGTTLYFFARKEAYEGARYTSESSPLFLLSLDTENIEIDTVGIYDYENQYPSSGSYLLLNLSQQKIYVFGSGLQIYDIDDPVAIFDTNFSYKYYIPNVFAALGFTGKEENTNITRLRIQHDGGVKEPAVYKRTFEEGVIKEKLITTLELPQENVYYNDFVFDTDSNIYAVGQLYVNDSISSLILTKYGTQFNLLWNREYFVQSNGVGERLLITQDGHLLVGLTKEFFISPEAADIEWHALNSDRIALRRLPYIMEFDGDGYFYKTLENEEVSLYPNPVNNTFQVIGYPGEQKIQIVDFKGVILETLFISEPTTQIKSANFKSGVYIIRFLDNANNLTRSAKFIKP